MECYHLSAFHCPLPHPHMHIRRFLRLLWTLSFLAIGGLVAGKHPDSLHILLQPPSISLELLICLLSVDATWLVYSPCAPCQGSLGGTQSLAAFSEHPWIDAPVVGPDE